MASHRSLTLGASLVLALVGVVQAGCGASGRDGGTEAAPGQAGTEFQVLVHRPSGGTVRSMDGRIACGTAGTACGPVSFPWSTVVTLTAEPDGGNMLGTWAGDCTYRGPCVLDTAAYGADKYVAAVFGPLGVAGHGNFTSPEVHGPEYVAYASGRADAFACDRCHGSAYGGVAIAPSCNDCHAAQGFADWRSDCGFCHAFPPATGAHAAHFGLAGASTTGVYGDTRVLQDLYPAATPTTAPARYAFGCGNCHPIDPAKHMNGSLEVEVRDPAAPASSLKAKVAATARYDAAAGTCSGTYCHSTGQASPTFKTTPSWATGKYDAQTRCQQCHDDPPLGLPGSHEYHVLSAPGPVVHNRPYWNTLHMAGPAHGGARYLTPHTFAIDENDDAAPTTCQTCHFGTVDPTNTTRDAAGNPVGYYYLDTGGSLGASCLPCHAAGGTAAASVGTGKTLPLHHVNGRRDVQFDPRTGVNDGPMGQSLSDVAWIPSVAGWLQYPGTQREKKPVQPYWIMNQNPGQWFCEPPYSGTDWEGHVGYCPPTAVFTRNYWYHLPMQPYCTNHPADCEPPHWEVSQWYGMIEFSLGGTVERPSSWDPQARTCTVACHASSFDYPQKKPTWGVYSRGQACFPCHGDTLSP